MGFIDLVTKFIDIVLNLDKYLGVLISQYGVWTYLIIFAVLFFETGVVFTPFLPGDSLLFAAGTMAGLGMFKLWILYFICVAAVLLGDNCNYWIGHFIGSTILKKNYRLINKKHVAKTRKFFDKYGAFTLVIGRFMPIIRTFTPFLAGIGRMPYWKFLLFDIVGAFSWVSLFIFGGYFFGGLPFVQENFSLIVILIIFVSFIPVFIQVGKHILENRRKAASKKVKK
jgi:membrane-associated protein